MESSGILSPSLDMRKRACKLFGHWWNENGECVECGVKLGEFTKP